MAFGPPSQGIDAVIAKQIDRTPAPEFADDDPLWVAAPPRPVVHADDAELEIVLAVDIAAPRCNPCA